MPLSGSWVITKCFNHGASTCWLRTEKSHQESQISGLPSPGPFMTTCPGRSGTVSPWPSHDPSVPRLHLTAYFCRKSCPNGESPLVPKASHILIHREAQHTWVNEVTYRMLMYHASSFSDYSTHSQYFIMLYLTVPNLHFPVGTSHVTNVIILQ